MKEAIKRIAIHQPTRIVIEATGRLETAFVCTAAKANLPVVIANTYHVYNFAVSTGKRAKTDKLDAKMIAHYGEALKLKFSEIKPDNTKHISDLLVRRAQLIEMRTMEKSRLSILPKTLHRSIKKIINTLQKEVDQTEQTLDELIKDTPDWHELMALLTSVKGVGKVLVILYSVICLSWVNSIGRK